MTDRTASVAGALEPAGSEDGSAAARATGLVLGLDPDTCLSAVEALASGRVAWVVISGKMAAGKDTIAPHVVDVLPAPTGAGPVFIGYGDLMRADLAGTSSTGAASWSSAESGM